MEDAGIPVYVSVCGRVERVDIMELTLGALCAAVSVRFDIGDRLRFTADDEDEREITTDEHLKRLAQQKQTLRVLISDTAILDLEQRMWQLRQLQCGFFQDELGVVKSHANVTRGELRQLRQAVEQSANREAELARELLDERQAREKLEAVVKSDHEALIQEIRREQHSRGTAEATFRKDLEEVRQQALKFAATLERHIQDVKTSLQDESSNRSKNMEALLSEWAASQSEIRNAIEAARIDIERVRQDSDKNVKNLMRESSARQAFEQFFSEKIAVVERALGKIEGNPIVNLDNRLTSSVQEAFEVARSEAELRLAAHKEQQLQQTSPDNHSQDLHVRLGELEHKANAMFGFVEKREDNSSPQNFLTSGSMKLPITPTHLPAAVQPTTLIVTNGQPSSPVNAVQAVHMLPPSPLANTRSVSPAPSTAGALAQGPFHIITSQTVSTVQGGTTPYPMPTGVWTPPNAGQVTYMSSASIPTTNMRRYS